jgi:uncharacterized protein (TIGR03382 family)
MNPNHEKAAATPAADTPAEAEQATRKPEEIEAEIEATREELGETVSALGEKTDVKAQAQRNPIPLAIAAGVGGLVALAWLRRRRR